MKRFSFYITILGILVAFSACNKNKPRLEALQFAPDMNYNMVFNLKKHTTTISFTANISWVAQVSNDATDWLSISENSGNKGEQNITVHIAQSKTRNERTGRITFIAANKEYVISISQVPDEFEFEENTNFTIVASNEQQSTTFAFGAYVNWTANIDGDALSWLTIQPSGMKEEAKIAMQIAANTTSNARTGTITVKGQKMSFVIRVTQHNQSADFDVFSAITDVDFKEYCKQFDSNKDGKLLISEVSSITSMNIQEYNVGDVKGIEYFSAIVDFTMDHDENSQVTLDFSNNTALKNMYLSSIPNLNSLVLNNNLETLQLAYIDELIINDFSYLTALKKLELHKCKKIGDSIDLSKNTVLEQFNCTLLPFKKIDLSNTALESFTTYLPNLQTLKMTNSKVTDIYIQTSSDGVSLSLDVSGCRALTSLQIERLLNKIDLTGCTALKHFSVYGSTNAITKIDINDNVALTHISLGKGYLTSLDVSKHNMLDTLIVINNNISKLDVSNNLKLTYLSCKQKQTSSGKNFLETLYMKKGQEKKLTYFDYPTETKIVYK